MPSMRGEPGDTGLLASIDLREWGPPPGGQAEDQPADDGPPLPTPPPPPPRRVEG